MLFSSIPGFSGVGRGSTRNSDVVIGISGIITYFSGLPRCGSIGPNNSWGLFSLRSHSSCMWPFLLRLLEAWMLSGNLKLL